MRKEIKILLNLILTMVSVFQLNAQISSNINNSDKLKEKVSLVTDRDVYAVLESVYFKAYNLSNRELRELEWSKVLYVEIITCDGKTVFYGKFPFDKQGAQGSFEIPKEIVTGNYYLKAYTKWMRNYSNSYYFYQAITIINPFTDQILQKPELHVTDFVLDTIFYKATKNISCDLFSDSIGQNKEVKALLIKEQNELRSDNYEVVINGKKVQLSKNEFEKLVNDGNNQAESINGIEYTATVISDDFSNDFVLQPRMNKINNTFKFEYLPETRSLSISGTVINEVTQKPIKHSKVHVSIFNGYTQSQSVLSDSVGRFAMALPFLYGGREIFISAESSSDNESIVQVDNDFCTKPINLPFIPFQITESEIAVYNTMIVNSQIEKQYEEVITEFENSDSLVNNIIYYNTPTLSIQLADYVDLPTLEDYFHELLPIVVISTNRGRKMMKVWGVFSELDFYSSLILIDDVILADADNLLKIAPSKIKSIEVLAYPYIKGNFTYGGVINIKSVNGDLGGINLPESGLFFNFNMYSARKYYKNNLNACYLSNPGLTNTLLWKPDLQFNDKNRTELVFGTGYNKGDFQLIIKGVNEKGEIYCYRKLFTIE